jgi:cell division protein FtsB
MIEALFTAAAWAKWLTGWLAWLGIGLVPFAGAVAVIWFFPPLRKWALLAAIGWGLWFGGYTLGGVREGAKVRAEWRAAEQRAIERGEAARESAEREVEQEDKAAPADVPAGRARRLPNDRYDRDNH